VNFLAHALIGSIRQGGVPYISWPALTMIVKEVTSLYITSNKETKRLQSITDSIIKENIQLEKQVFDTGSDLVSYSSADGYIAELKSQDKKFQDLIDFFEE